MEEKHKLILKMFSHCGLQRSLRASWRNRVTSAACSPGLWAAWCPDGRLRRSTVSGLCSPPQSVEAFEQTPITTSQEHHTYGASSIILGDAGWKKRRTVASQCPALWNSHTLNTAFQLPSFSYSAMPHKRHNSSGYSQVMIAPSILALVCLACHWGPFVWNPRGLLSSS